MTLEQTLQAVLKEKQNIITAVKEKLKCISFQNYKEVDLESVSKELHSVHPYIKSLKYTPLKLLASNSDYALISNNNVSIELHTGISPIIRDYHIENLNRSIYAKFLNSDSSN